MGTIQKRDDNKGRTTYQARVRKTGFPALSKNFDTKADAQQWITEREAEMSRGVFVDTRAADEWTVGRLLARYREEVTPKKKGAEVEGIRIKAMERDRISQFAVAHLTPKAVAEYRDRRIAAGKSGATVNRDLATLHHVLEIARKEWSIGMPNNAVSQVSRAKANPGRTRRLSPEEEQALRAACKATRNGYLEVCITLALETAMRQSEIIGLDWEFIDLDKRVIHLTVTKNGEGRGVPLSSAAVAALKEIDAPMIHGKRHGPVFKGVTASALKQSFAKTVDRAGLVDFRFHDLRHEATSRLFEKQFNPMEVSSVTGHKSLAMLKRYTHLMAADLAKRLG
ncbi:MAG: Tyrosine recombinase XerC [Herbaspirillum frisingense]|uniref:Tyrosine recombinase XerC n=1 Tax=Herbaspirillum frisingense TaxID=92645 RepID=A0A7V8FWH6_9BURK|nr:MAG: Tyrosine recombinase XerC [Herbaspirillum frisingense]